MPPLCIPAHALINLFFPALRCQREDWYSTQVHTSRKGETRFRVQWPSGQVDAHNFLFCFPGGDDKHDLLTKGIRRHGDSRKTAKGCIKTLSSWQQRKEYNIVAIILKTAHYTWIMQILDVWCDMSLDFPGWIHFFFIMLCLMLFLFLPLSYSFLLPFVFTGNWYERRACVHPWFCQTSCISRRYSKGCFLILINLLEHVLFLLLVIYVKIII